MCGQILGTYPKYCPYCGGQPMTTDGEERIVPVPESREPKYVYKTSDPNGGRPRVQKVERKNFGAVNTTPNYRNEARPSQTRTSSRYRDRRAEQRPWYDPPASDNARSADKKAKARPEQRTQPKTGETVKLSFKASTPEERMINRLSALCTAVVVLISGYFGTKAALNNDGIRQKLGYKTASAEKTAEETEDISEIAVPSMRESLDLQQKEFTDPVTLSNNCGSLRYDSEIWALEDTKAPEDAITEYTLYPRGHINDIGLIIRFDDTGDKTFTSENMMSDMCIKMDREGYDRDSLISGKKPYEYYTASFSKDDLVMNVTCMCHKGRAVTIYYAGSTDAVTDYLSDLYAIITTIDLNRTFN